MIVGLEEALERLARDEVLAYPTETVYGLGVNAASATALAGLRVLKGRAAAQALSVLVADVEALARLVTALPESARALAERFWPGPLTLVIRGAAEELAGVASPLGVGFRCSPQPTARLLAERARSPVVSTSCNRHGEPACLNAPQVSALFGEALPIAGGEPAGGGAPSTVVAIDPQGKLQLLREGELPFERLVAELAA